VLSCAQLRIWIRQSSKLYPFVDSKNQFDENKIDIAFQVWKIAHKTNCKTAQEWFENWVVVIL